MTYDVIIVGLGGMGSAAAANLTRRGLKVLGIDQFNQGHALGSSHGHTRIIRTAYFEHPNYVPLCQASFGLWYDLEQRLGKTLLIDCPCLTLGPTEGELVRGVLDAARQQRLAVEQLDQQELHRRYPQFRVSESSVGVLEHASGILLVDECVRSLQQEARDHGAELRFGENVVEWKAVNHGVAVRTPWETLSAAKLVITAGPWAKQLLSDLRLPLTVMRQTPMWFQPIVADAFRRDRFPIFIADALAGNFYGMPMLDRRGIKCARHYAAPELAGPDGVDRCITENDELPVRSFLEQHIPQAAGARTDGSVCLYTLSPDRHFIIDQHPRHSQVALAAGFSGHGFKFAPVVGAVLADLILQGHTEFPIGLFQLDRLPGFN